MSNAPFFWKTRPEEQEETLSLVKRGTVTKVGDSAGGRPIYKVEYGKSNLPKGTANLSSALGAHDIRAYADKTGADYIPTVFLVGCVHGGEFEGTAAVLNLIKMIETGTDYKGERDEELISLVDRVHLIIIPMANPDGRCHIPFDTYVGRTFFDLRYYNQGTWKDGTLCGHPGCKKITPLKDHVDYLGGYFNDAGENMMHEDFFGKVSAGTRAVLDVCREEAPDFSILLHGGDNCRNYLCAPCYSAIKVKKEICELELMIDEASKKENIPFLVRGLRRPEENETPPAFNLESAMHHCCGEPAITYECNQGLCDWGQVSYTHEQMYSAHKILFRETIKHVLKKYGKL